MNPKPRNGVRRVFRRCGLLDGGMRHEWRDVPGQEAQTLHHAWFRGTALGVQGSGLQGFSQGMTTRTPGDVPLRGSPYTLPIWPLYISLLERGPQTQGYHRRGPRESLMIRGLRLPDFNPKP